MRCDPNRHKCMFSSGSPTSCQKQSWALYTQTHKRISGGRIFASHPPTVKPESLLRSPNTFCIYISVPSTPTCTIICVHRRHAVAHRAASQCHCLGGVRRRRLVRLCCWCCAMLLAASSPPSGGRVQARCTCVCVCVVRFG